MILIKVMTFNEMIFKTHKSNSFFGKIAISHKNIAHFLYNCAIEACCYRTGSHFYLLRHLKLIYL